MSTLDFETARTKREAALSGYRGDETVARSYLHHPAASVRATAFAALARSKYLTDADLKGALSDPDGLVRRRGCALASGRETIDLRDLLADDDNSVVEMAAWAIGEQGSTNAVDHLSNVVYSHEDALCRESAVAALGALGEENGLPAILHATMDKPAVRRRAVIALAPFEGKEVDEALQKATTDRDWQVRQAAEDLLNAGSGPDPVEDEWNLDDDTPDQQ